MEASSTSMKARSITASAIIQGLTLPSVHRGKTAACLAIAVRRSWGARRTSGAPVEFMQRRVGFRAQD